MPAIPVRIALIVGSTREGRFGPTVAGWFVTQVARHGGVELTVLDLAAIEIPSAAFAERIGAADGFVVVTPEYNHSFPGPLKTALDSVGSRGRPSRSPLSPTAGSPAGCVRWRPCARCSPSCTPCRSARR